MMENTELSKSINDLGIKILDGRWLFKFMLYEIIEYISKAKSEKIEFQTVAILIKNNDEIINSQLLEIAKAVRTLKIITDKKIYFSNLEQVLYDKFGIAIQIANNKYKSLTNVNIILNIDFEEEKLNEYNINPKACVVNIKWKNRILDNNFFGLNIVDYKIKYNKESFENIAKEDRYNENILYESYIYRKGTFPNIKKQLNVDNVAIEKFITEDGNYV